MTAPTMPAQTEATDTATQAAKLARLNIFMGEQEEREAVVAYLQRLGDSKPHGTDWRAYYEAAEAIELGKHRQAINGVQRKARGEAK